MSFDVIWHTPLAVKPGSRPGYVKLYAPVSVFCKRISMTVCGQKDWEFDLDSVPRIPIVYWLLKGRCGKRAAAIHDLLYAQQPAGVTRRDADLVMWDQMVQDEIKLRWRVPILLGVRLGGWWGWRCNKR
jgi:hypothetical protein